MNRKIALLIFNIVFIASYFGYAYYESKPSNSDSPSSSISDLPQPNESFYVLDSANLLTPETEQTIINYNIEMEKTDEAPQIVVVTIPTTEDNSIEEYAVDLFEEWGIGNADYDNGVLLLVTADGHERLEIGYGLEGTIPDSLAGSYLSRASVYFDSQKYNEGVINVFDEVKNDIMLEYAISDSLYTEKELNYDSSVHDTSNDISPWWIAGFIVFMAVLYMISPKAFWIILDILRVIIAIFGSSSSSGSSKRSSGGGGRSGGGGASS